ncbi:MAG: hypothetical protein PUC73_11980 [Lachnospiraceae bacterium]|nr:hypothetical protein [Lachnospiraceae bacterium]
MKKELLKKLSFVLLVMAVFFAGVALNVLQSSTLAVCIAGVFLLAASVFFVLLREEKSQSPGEKTTEVLLADRMAELMRGNEKAEKGVYLAVKKQHETMESGMAALEEKISELIKAQENAVKTLVLYNKENAKQLALNEREEMERLREELRLLQQEKKGTQDTTSPVVEAVKDMTRRLYEEIHENSEAMLSELETTVDSLDEIKQLLSRTGGKGLLSSEPAHRKRPEPEDIDAEEILSEEIVIEEPLPENEPEEIVIEEPLPEEEPEEIVIEEPLPENEPEEIVTEEPLPEEEPEEAVTEPVLPEEVAEPEPLAEEKTEDAFASSGVDLSDPNKMLSADDIAALFASLGN